MISKLLQIFVSAVIFGALIINIDSAHADGMDYSKKNHKTKHSRKVCHKNHVHHKPCYKPAPCPKPCDKLIKGNATIGVSGDWGYAINQNNDTLFTGITPILGIPAAAPAPEIIALPGFSATAFNDRYDYAYGANASVGYMTFNGFEANFELGYHQIKKKGNISPSFIKSDIVSGLINGTYYAHISNIILPYVSVGIGVARTKANGAIMDNISALSSFTGLTATNAANNLPFDVNAINNRDILVFNDLKSTRLAYQGGLGLSAMFDNALVGVGYKFFGVNSIDSNDSDFNDFRGRLIGFAASGAAGATTVATAVTASATTIPLSDVLVNTTNPNFGSITNQIHNLSIFAKFIV